MTQSGQGVTTTNPLTFFKNFFVTGDHVAYGVTVRDTGGIGTIGIPANAITVPNAQPVAAFLYWATVVTANTLDAGLVGAKFKGNDISGVGKRLSPREPRRAGVPAAVRARVE